MTIQKSFIWLVLPIILVGVFLRCLGFWMPHDEPRELLYTALAVRLDEGGSREYNLKQVGIKRLFFKNNPSVWLTYPVEASPVPEDVRLAESILGEDVSDLPLFYEPPYFPMSLVMAHRWLAELKQPYTIIQSSSPADKKCRPEARFFKFQFWAVFISFAASIVALMGTYFFASRLFGAATGLLSATFLAVCPFDVINAMRITPESIFTLFIVLTFWVLWEALERKSAWGCFWTGIFYALALLTKLEAWFFLPAVVGMIVISQREESSERAAAYQWIFNWKIAGFVAGVYFITGHRFRHMAEVYGNPFFIGPYLERSAGTISPKSWLIIIASWPVILFSLAVIKISKKEKPLLLLGLWALPLLLFCALTGQLGRPELLSATLPALAILAGRGVVQLKESLSTRRDRALVTPALKSIVVLLSLLSLWTLWIGVFA